MFLKLTLLQNDHLQHFAGVTRSGPEKISVIIVGAGMAGLAAARRLVDHSGSYDVTVLEANPTRYGGRIYSFEVPGQEGTAR